MTYSTLLSQVGRSLAPLNFAELLLISLKTLDKNRTFLGTDRRAVTGWILCAVGISLAGFVPTASAQEVSFSRDVRRILSDRCYHCHGPDANNQESSYRLDTREHAYDAIEPGDLESSELHTRIRMSGEGRMPPADAPRQLTEAEKDTLDAWIKAGAPFDDHWAFEPIPDKIDVPQPVVAEPEGWPRGEVDQFILAGLKATGIQPNRESSKEKWLRRVTFDLTGLPPTLDQIDAFVGDTSDNAYETVVDRLLASDACAERLTSEWLDVARYSDTQGYQRDDERLVWPYRDWVIKAFKQNMPYDQFVTWQLAGDLMENPSRDQIVATVFNRLHSHKKEGGVALEEFRVENVADRTHTFGAAFMGLTLECARCHDHKYDPTKMKEYYQLSSFFANIDERGLISYFTDAAPTPAAPLPSQEQERQLAAAQQQIVAAETSLRSTIDQASNGFDRFVQGLADAQTPLRAADLMPGKVAHLAFERIAEIPKPKKGHYVAEDTGKLVADQIRELVNSVPTRNQLDAPEAADNQDTAGVEDNPGNKAKNNRTQADKEYVLTKPWTNAANRLVAGKQGQAIALTGDDAVVLPGIGHYGRHQSFSVSLWIKPGETDERSVIFRRSRGWDDAGSVGYELTKLGDRLSAKLVHFWPGNAICVETDSVLKSDQWYHVAFTYDGSSTAAGLKIYVDGVDAGTQIVQDHLTRNITQWRKGYRDLAIGARYRDRGFKDGLVDEFQVFSRTLAPIELRQLFDSQSLRRIVDKIQAGQALAPKQKADLLELYIATEHPETIQARAALADARRTWNEVMDATPAISVMRERKTPRPAYMLTRGVYDQRGEQVTAETPEFLPGFPADAPRNRLGLAQWITSPDHPLMARVTANRYWQMIFGQGLVATPEDFGLQGESPTHAELLDWLSRDLIENDWNIRRMLRMLVLSATYRQSSTVPMLVRDRDPENKWLGRSPGRRLSAEMIRDNSLAVSGLLNPAIGGPPVKPYDVALAYTPLPVDEGEKLYRRSLYTFWKRTSPSPVMMTMNANKREVCRLQREVTDSPLQALVLMNGMQFIEASRSLGGQLLKKHDGNIEDVVREAFRKFTSRKSADAEVLILVKLFEEQLEIFERDPDQAKSLLETGQATNIAGVSETQLAAATVLINAIMNLNESVK